MVEKQLVGVVLETEGLKEVVGQPHQLQHTGVLALLVIWCVVGVVVVGGVGVVGAGDFVLLSVLLVVLLLVVLLVLVILYCCW